MCEIDESKRPIINMFSISRGFQFHLPFLFCLFVTLHFYFYFVLIWCQCNFVKFIWFFWRFVNFMDLYKNRHRFGILEENVTMLQWTFFIQSQLIILMKRLKSIPFLIPRWCISKQKEKRNSDYYDNDQPNILSLQKQK